MVRPPKERLDEYLVRNGDVESLAMARALIMAGDVVVNDQRIDKPGTRIDAEDQIRIKNQSRFVSRGGDKLESAILYFSLQESFKGKTILDVGASTGGFTDCALTYGAAKVFALDVGRHQLAWKMLQDVRVESIEQTDVREFKFDKETQIDWVLSDVSFTSLAGLIKEFHRLAPLAKILILVKPQFELPKEKIPDGGIVVNESDRALALDQVIETLKQFSYRNIKTFESAVVGRYGNQETFILAEPPPKPS